MGTRKSVDQGVSVTGRRCMVYGAGFLVVLAAAGGLAPCARAEMPGSSSQNRSVAVWNRMDACKREAWRQHPDYTPDGNAKRDQAVKRCLAANNLPPVAPLAPEPPPSAGSSR